MAEQGEKTEAATEQANGGSDADGGGHTAVRVAAIAAATGATALAAKKALSSRGQSGEEGQKRSKPQGSSGDGASMFTEMLESGWSAAKDSLLPFAEDAAGAAGEWVARSGPELVADTLVPRFIRGFERARKSSGDDAAEE